MELTFAIIAICLVFGFTAALASFRPSLIPDIGSSLRQSETVKKFSPRNTLFIIGPSANHAACKLQRRLLKPAIAALIREEVSVMEIYGDATPRQNGDAIEWLDPALLRHALNAENGFFVIYVDNDGKTLFRSEAPMVTADILARAGLDIASPSRNASSRKNAILKKLRAA